MSKERVQFSLRTCLAYKPTAIKVLQAATLTIQGGDPQGVTLRTAGSIVIGADTGFLDSTVLMTNMTGNVTFDGEGIGVINNKRGLLYLYNNSPTNGSAGGLISTAGNPVPLANYGTIERNGTGTVEVDFQIQNLDRDSLLQVSSGTLLVSLPAGSGVVQYRGSTYLNGNTGAKLKLNSPEGLWVRGGNLAVHGSGVATIDGQLKMDGGNLLIVDGPNGPVGPGQLMITDAIEIRGARTTVNMDVFCVPGSPDVCNELISLTAVYLYGGDLRIAVHGNPQPGDDLDIIATPFDWLIGDFNNTFTAPFTTDGESDLTWDYYVLKTPVNKRNGRLDLGSSGNPVAWGQPVTFTAVVSAVDEGAPTPTGTVTFMDGGTALGNATLDGNGNATLTTSALAPGSHWIVAVYSGDANFNGNSSSPLEQVVNPAGASIGDYVWYDPDSDGIQDPGELGLPGVTVNLLDGSGNLLASTPADSSGYYEFDGLLPGNYQLQFVAPPGYQFSPQGEGADSSLDSDADPSGRTVVVSLATDEDQTDLDAGLYSTGSGGIGDFVWDDLNANGIQDPGEPGLSGMTVNLLDGLGNWRASTTTDGSGHYQFAGLAPGNYQLQFIAPPGYQFSLQGQGGDSTRDSDADPSGRTAVLSLAADQNRTDIDAGLYFTGSGGSGGSIGDFVWDDLNDNGIQDAGEPGLSGVTVNLLDGLGNWRSSTTSDGSGHYQFGGLAPGNYQLQFVPPSGYQFSPQGAGGDSTQDSDANASGATAVLSLATNQRRTDLDAGLFSTGSGGSGGSGGFAAPLALAASGSPSAEGVSAVPGPDGELHVTYFPPPGPSNPPGAPAGTARAALHSGLSTWHATALLPRPLVPRLSEMARSRGAAAVTAWEATRALGSWTRCSPSCLRRGASTTAWGGCSDAAALAR
jgi:protocatechuate 3,4-dioxygenase beta subunit